MSELINKFPEDLQPKKCPFCQRTVDTGLAFNRIRERFLVACPCGLHSITFATMRELLIWWNTRAGRVPDVPQLQDASTTHSSRIQKPSGQDAF